MDKKQYKAALYHLWEMKRRMYAVWSILILSSTASNQIRLEYWHVIYLWLFIGRRNNWFVRFDARVCLFIRAHAKRLQILLLPVQIMITSTPYLLETNNLPRSWRENYIASRPIVCSFVLSRLHKARHLQHLYKGTTFIYGIPICFTNYFIPFHRKLYLKSFPHLH